MSDSVDDYTRVDPDTVEDQHLGYGTFDCPNGGSSVFSKEVMDGVYIETCTQDCDYAVYAPLYVASDGSIAVNFNEAYEIGLDDEAEGRLPERED